jgi:xanthosine utilization system XapX-like protein
MRCGGSTEEEIHQMPIGIVYSLPDMQPAPPPPRGSFIQLIGTSLRKGIYILEWNVDVVISILTKNTVQWCVVLCCKHDQLHCRKS